MSVRPDAVYHLAGQADVKTWGKPLDTFRINAEGTLNLLEACKAGTKRVLCVSSAEVYGVVEVKPSNKNLSLYRQLIHATSKAAELICEQYNSESECNEGSIFQPFRSGASENFVA